jgi:hypothetical protein
MFESGCAGSSSPGRRMSPRDRLSRISPHGRFSRTKAFKLDDDSTSSSASPEQSENRLQKNPAPPTKKAVTIQEPSNEGKRPRGGDLKQALVWSIGSVTPPKSPRSRQSTNMEDLNKKESLLTKMDMGSDEDELHDSGSNDKPALQSPRQPLSPRKGSIHSIGTRLRMSPRSVQNSGGNKSRPGHVTQVSGNHIGARLRISPTSSSSNKSKTGHLHLKYQELDEDTSIVADDTSICSPTDRQARLFAKSPKHKPEWQLNRKRIIGGSKEYLSPLSLRKQKKEKKENSLFEEAKKQVEHASTQTGALEAVFWSDDDDCQGTTPSSKHIETNPLVATSRLLALPKEDATPIARLVVAHTTSSTALAPPAHDSPIGGIIRPSTWRTALERSRTLSTQLPTPTVSHHPEDSQVKAVAEYEISVQDPRESSSSAPNRDSEEDAPLKTVAASPRVTTQSHQKRQQRDEDKDELDDDEHSDDEELEAIMKGLCLSGDSAESTISSKDVFAQLLQQNTSQESIAEKEGEVTECEDSVSKVTKKYQGMHDSLRDLTVYSSVQLVRETPRDVTVMRRTQSIKDESQTFQEPEGELMSELILEEQLPKREANKIERRYNDPEGDRITEMVSRALERSSDNESNAQEPEGELITEKVFVVKDNTTDNYGLKQTHKRTLADARKKLLRGKPHTRPPSLMNDPFREPQKAQQIMKEESNMKLFGGEPAQYKVRLSVDQCSVTSKQGKQVNVETAKPLQAGDIKGEDKDKAGCASVISTRDVRLPEIPIPVSDRFMHTPVTSPSPRLSRVARLQMMRTMSTALKGTMKHRATPVTVLKQNLDAPSGIVPGEKETCVGFIGPGQSCLAHDELGNNLSRAMVPDTNSNQNMRTVESIAMYLSSSTSKADLDADKKPTSARRGNTTVANESASFGIEQEDNLSRAMVPDTNSNQSMSTVESIAMYSSSSTSEADLDDKKPTSPRRSNNTVANESAAFGIEQETVPKFPMVSRSYRNTRLAKKYLHRQIAAAESASEISDYTKHFNREAPAGNFDATAEEPFPGPIGATNFSSREATVENIEARIQKESPNDFVGSTASKSPISRPTGSVLSKQLRSLPSASIFLTDNRDKDEVSSTIASSVVENSSIISDASSAKKRKTSLISAVTKKKERMALLASAQQRKNVISSQLQGRVNDQMPTATDEQTRLACKSVPKVDKKPSDDHTGVLPPQTEAGAAKNLRPENESLWAPGARNIQDNIVTPGKPSTSVATLEHAGNHTTEKQRHDVLGCSTMGMESCTSEPSTFTKTTTSRPSNHVDEPSNDFFARTSRRRQHPAFAARSKNKRGGHPKKKNDDVLTAVASSNAVTKGASQAEIQDPQDNEQDETNYVAQQPTGKNSAVPNSATLNSIFGDKKAIAFAYWKYSQAKEGRKWIFPSLSYWSVLTYLLSAISSARVVKKNKKPPAKVTCISDENGPVSSKMSGATYVTNRELEGEDGRCDLLRWCRIPSLMLTLNATIRRTPTRKRASIARA